MRSVAGSAGAMRAATTRSQEAQKQQNEKCVYKAQTNEEGKEKEKVWGGRQGYIVGFN